MREETIKQRMLIGVMALLALSTIGCGGDDGGGGAAGSGGMIGETCISSCAPGLICSRGRFAGLCTVQCSNDSACLQFDVKASCFGTAAPECALRCELDVDCPTGTVCRPVPEGNVPKACTR